MKKETLVNKLVDVLDILREVKDSRPDFSQYLITKNIDNINYLINVAENIKSDITELKPNQIRKAEAWYSAHNSHVDKLVAQLTSGFPPSEHDDVNNPSLWKPEHWKWFLAIDDD